MANSKCYAHSLAGRGVEEWQGLEEHLIATGDLAEAFGCSFAPGWGRIAGLWHDAGKYRRAFQEYIGKDAAAHTNQRVDHSSAGAVLARERKTPLLSFVVAGHHGGMPDGAALQGRLDRTVGLLAEARAGGLPAWIEQHPVPGPPDWLKGAADRAVLSLWTRFLFSALVDADFLDTERFYAGGADRDLGANPGIAELRSRLDRYLREKSERAERTPVNEIRARVLSACRDAAELDCGAFTLTVPTGGGKTLSSLMFALEHAARHDLTRVIVVIPYTSIIEQTAAVYREALGENAVVEHHTNVDPDIETPLNRLASENWDAPVVVTTSVQFFESLYANRPARCRKLHRIARSVVVFDEVQTFPVHLLRPVQRAIRELSQHYGASVLLCTATQPELIQGAREIVPDTAREFAVVANRCEVLMPSSDAPITWDGLASEVRQHERVLAIVHRRDDAQRLAELVGGDSLHLSARMCAAHRSVVLADVKRRLTNGESCRLVATQLVEAGVDVDFPEVYRAFAGADSLAQAAGRCNREGRGNGRLHVFIAPTNPPRGILQTAFARAKQMREEGLLDLKAPGTFAEYFRRLYESAEQDARAVMAEERSQNFQEVARLFRMIDDHGEPVVAPYDDWEGRVADVRRNGISRLRMRRLQPFIVSLYRQEIQALLQAGALERIAETFWAVVPGFRVYDDQWGFGWKGTPLMEPESLIA